MIQSLHNKGRFPLIYRKSHFLAALIEGKSESYACLWEAFQHQQIWIYFHKRGLSNSRQVAIGGNLFHLITCDWSGCYLQRLQTRLQSKSRSLATIPNLDPWSQKQISWGVSSYPEWSHQQIDRVRINNRAYLSFGDLQKSLYKLVVS